MLTDYDGQPTTARKVIFRMIRHLTLACVAMAAVFALMYWMTIDFRAARDAGLLG